MYRGIDHAATNSSEKREYGNAGMEYAMGCMAHGAQKIILVVVGLGFESIIRGFQKQTSEIRRVRSESGKVELVD